MRVVGQSSRSTPWLRRIVVAGTIGVVALAGLGVFRPDFVRSVVRSPRQALIQTPRTFVESRMHRVELPILQFDVKHRHYEQLLAKRNEALQMGILQTSDDDFVPAGIRLRENGEELDLDAKIRLKGDWPDHFRTDKWSYRIKFRGESHFHGMKRVSIQHPEARAYLGEWAFLRALRNEGVLAPRYEFVEMVFNGSPKGIFAVEEHFAKELLESQERREGPILKLDENPHWQQRRLAHEQGVHWLALDALDFYTGRPDFFGRSAIDENPVLAKHAAAARALFESYRSGQTSASEVFDVELMAKYLAMCRVWGANHGLFWHNLRFYYNPVSTRLEPIAFDGEPSSWDVPEMWNTNLISGPELVPGMTHWYPWLDELLSDPVLLPRYFHYLRSYSDPEYLDRVIAELDPEITPLFHTLRTEWPFVEKPWAALRRGAGFVRGKLDPHRSLVARRGGGAGAILEVANIADVPFRVLGLRAGAARFALEPTLIPGRKIRTPLEWITLVPKEPLPATPADSLLLLFESPDGARRWEEPVAVRQELPVLGGIHPPAGLPAELAAKHEFLEWDGQRLTIRPGDWSIDEDLSLAQGIPLRIAPGTTLRFAPGTLLLVRGALECRGTAELPITLGAQDPQSGWEGLLVLGAGDQSTLEHVEFSDTRTPQRSTWELTGGVTFYQSPVEFTDCKFQRHRGEDALNVFRSTLSMTRVLIADCPSDAFDGDFVQGSISDCVLNDVQGDGIDVSGSDIIVSGLIARRIGDKAISIGESSRARVLACDIEAANIGIASKDLSTVNLHGGRISQTTYGLAAYTKKPTYGPATIFAQETLFEDYRTLVLVDTDSKVSIDERSYESSELDVKALYAAGILGN